MIKHFGSLYAGYVDLGDLGLDASLWNFRAFTERDFHRIDHLRAAMGVLGTVVNLRVLVSKRLFSSFPRKRESRIRLLANTYLLPMAFGFPLSRE